MPLKDCSPLGLPELEQLSAETIARDEPYNQDVVAWGKLRSEFRAASRDLGMVDTVAVTAAELRQRRHDAEQLELTILQGAVLLCGRYLHAAAERLKELQAYADAVASEAEKVEQRVIKKLNSAGVSIETQPAYATNSAAAKQTFMRTVGESTDYRAAQQKVSDANSVVQSVSDSIGFGKTRLATAQSELRAAVRRLVGLPPEQPRAAEPMRSVTLGESVEVDGVTGRFTPPSWRAA